MKAVGSDLAWITFHVGKELWGRDPIQSRDGKPARWVQVSPIIRTVFRNQQVE